MAVVVLCDCDAVVGKHQEHISEKQRHHERVREADKSTDLKERGINGGGAPPPWFQEPKGEEVREAI